MTSPEECLPPPLRGPGTTIARVGAGLSGAGVWRVDAAGQTFVLKVATDGEPLAAWRAKLQVQTLAAAAGVAPAVVHADEARRAILSAFVVDRSFPAFWVHPNTRDAALALLGRTIRRVHALPPPPDVVAKDPRVFLAELWSGMTAASLPSFVAGTVERVLAEEPPASTRAPVLAHNDVNPSNLAYDGERLVLLDWDVAGINDPLHDLATIAVFLRMDEPTCRALLAAYDDAPLVDALPARFDYRRRLVAAFAGTMLLHLARLRGHAGARGDETLLATLSLGDFYARMRAGTLTPATPDGQWLFGLALVKECGR